jgi:hypothetical protein
MQTAMIQMVTQNSLLVSILLRPEEESVSGPLSFRFDCNFDSCPETGVAPAARAIFDLAEGKASRLFIDGHRISVDCEEIVSALTRCRSVPTEV